MDPNAWPDEIKRLASHLRGGRYLSPEAWESVVCCFPIGRQIKARIVGRAPFGLWLDVGAPLPALMRIVHTNDPAFDYQRYVAEEWGRLGDEICVRIVDVNDRQIHVEGASS